MHADLGRVLARRSAENVSKRSKVLCRRVPGTLTSTLIMSAGKMVGSSALPKVFMGSSASLGRGNGTRVNALFKVRS